MTQPQPAEPVADRGYRDKVTKIEPYGVDHIPDVERHGKPNSQLSIWFAAGMNFPIMLLGFYGVSFGLSFGAAAWAIVTGSLVGSVVMGVLSRMGVRLGVPQQIQARGPLGFFGNFLPVAYINVFAGIGWAAVTVILGGQALHELVSGIPFWLAALVLVALQLVVALFGYNMIHFLQRILAYLLFAGFALISVVAITRGHHLIFAANPKAPYYVGATGGWITLMGYFLSFLIAWFPFASDYSRYLPDSPTVTRRAGIYTWAGNFVSLAWLGIIGALLGSSAAAGASPITALRDLTGPWAVPALLTILLSSFSQNFLNVYGGAISIQTLRIPVSRRVAVIMICVPAFLISLWASPGFETKFETFLDLGAYLIAPYAAVLLLDYYIGGRKDKARLGELFDDHRILGWGFVAWLGGSLASMPFWQLSIFTGPVARALPGWGDDSYFVGFAVAVAVYLLTYRMKPLWVRRRATSFSDPPQCGRPGPAEGRASGEGPSAGRAAPSGRAGTGPMTR